MATTIQPTQGLSPHHSPASINGGSPNNSSTTNHNPIPPASLGAAVAQLTNSLNGSTSTGPLPSSVFGNNTGGGGGNNNNNSSRMSNVGKLFVGQVPYIATEELLQPLFAPYGTLLEIKIMRDPEGRSRGCAWVRYETQEQAQQAIEALHDKHTIPPQTNMLQVRFAQPSRSAGGQQSNPNMGGHHNNNSSSSGNGYYNAYGGGGGLVGNNNTQQQQQPVGYSPAGGNAAVFNANSGQQQQQQQLFYNQTPSAANPNGMMVMVGGGPNGGGFNSGRGGPNAYAGNQRSAFPPQQQQHNQAGYGGNGNYQHGGVGNNSGSNHTTPVQGYAPAPQYTTASAPPNHFMNNANGNAPQHLNMYGPNSHNNNGGNGTNFVGQQPRFFAAGNGMPSPNGGHHQQQRYSAGQQQQPANVFYQTNAGPQPAGQQVWQQQQQQPQPINMNQHW